MILPAGRWRYAVAAFVVLVVLGAIGGCVLQEITRDRTGRVISRAGPAPYVGLPSCPDAGRKAETLRMYASPEKAGLLHDLGQDYGNRESGGTCFAVEVTARSSNDVARDLLGKPATAPDVWSPASTRWLGQSSLSALLDPPPPSLFSSPVVIAMPRPMASALGWPRARIGWRELATLAGDPRGWGAYGHPEWGPFRLGKTNPAYSTSGLSATIGIDYALTRQPGDERPLTVADVTDPATVTRVRDFEKAVVHYGRNTLAYLTNLRHATETLTYVSAVALEESSMIAYNRGYLCGAVYLSGTDCERLNPPATPLVAVGPVDGVLVSDHPYVTMPGLSPEKKRVADDFLSFVRSERPQRKVGDAGFRGPPLAGDDLLPDGVRPLPEPDPAVVRRILELWPQVRKPANVVLAIDTSGSMKEPATGGTKMDLVRRAGPAAVAGFGDRDRVALWSFSSGYRTIVPPATMTADRRAAVTTAIDRLEPAGDTALHRTVAAAVDDVRRRWDPGAINAVIVLTDGRDDIASTIDLDTLTARIAPGDRPVRVFTIAYGGNADQAALKRIAEATGAGCYDAADPSSIADALTDVVSNF